LEVSHSIEFKSDITGTGKTVAFAIGILQRLDTEIKQCQALVLVPTHESAQQIVKRIGALGDFMHVKIHACVGDKATRDDIHALQDGVQVVVGTPERVYDMIYRRGLKLDNVQLFVLDEADEMLSNGFKEQIYDVFKFMPETVQCTIV
jgi:translation initiation factor 4A